MDSSSFLEKTNAKNENKIPIYEISLGKVLALKGASTSKVKPLFLQPNKNKLKKGGEKLMH